MAHSSETTPRVGTRDPARAMPFFTISQWRGRWWMDRDSPELGFTEQAVGPFATKLKAAAMARWMNRRNGHSA